MPVAASVPLPGSFESTYTLDPIRKRDACADDRAPANPLVDSTPAERDAILLEMRTMLQSLSGIMHGLIASDLDMARKAAGASGMAAALDPGLEKHLPAGYRQLD